jgi:hypothetical protein
MVKKEEDKRAFFKRTHQGNYEALQQEVESFFADTLKAADDLKTRFKQMLDRRFDDDLIKAYLENLFPEPTKPARADDDSRVKNLYLARLQKIKEARSQISRLRLNGKGSDIRGAKESLWGTFNAVLEFIDHYEKNKQPKFRKEECPTKEHFTESEIWQIHFWPVDGLFQELAFQSDFEISVIYLD